MDFETSVLELLRVVKHPIRLPTARWLITDVFNTLDSDNNFAIQKLIDLGKLKLTSGGWLNVV